MLPHLAAVINTDIL